PQAASASMATAPAAIPRVNRFVDIRPPSLVWTRSLESAFRTVRPPEGAAQGCCVIVITFAVRKPRNTAEKSYGKRIPPGACPARVDARAPVSDPRARVDLAGGRQVPRAPRGQAGAAPA